MLPEAMYTFNPVSFTEKFPKVELKKQRSVERSNEKSRSTLPDTPDNIQRLNKKIKITKFKKKNPGMFKAKKPFKIIFSSKKFKHSVSNKCIKKVQVRLKTLKRLRPQSGNVKQIFNGNYTFGKKELLNLKHQNQIPTFSPKKRTRIFSACQSSNSRPKLKITLKSTRPKKINLVLQVKNLKKFSKGKCGNAFSAGNNGNRKFFGIDYANSKRKIPFKIF